LTPVIVGIDTQEHQPTCTSRSSYQNRTIASVANQEYVTSCNLLSYPEPNPSRDKTLSRSMLLHVINEITMGSPASSSTPFTTATPSILAVLISEKLTKSNYPLWSVQVLMAICAARLEGLLTDIEKSPEEFISVTNEDKTIVK
jgi:hypothetical protein